MGIRSRTQAGSALVDVRDLTWFAFARIVVSRAVVGVVLGLTLIAALPALFGFDPSTVVSGSMEPRIRAGAIVLTSPLPAEEYQIGQVVSFPDPAGSGRQILHRIVGETGEGLLVTRGDANAVADSTPVDRESITGVARILVPIVGTVVLWAMTGEWMLVAVSIVVLALAIRGSFRVPSLLPVGRSGVARAIAETAAVTVVAAFVVVMLVGHLPPASAVERSGVRTEVGMQLSTGDVADAASPASAGSRGPSHVP